MDSEALLTNTDEEEGEEREEMMSTLHPTEDDDCVILNGQTVEDEEDTIEGGSLIENYNRERGTLKHRLFSLLTIAACFVLLCTQGFDYTFGNINPYLTSYLRNVTNNSVTYTDTLWIYQIKSVSSCVALPLVGMFANRLHTKVYMFLGLVCSTVFIFGTYLGLVTSFWVMGFFYSIVGGFPGAFFYPTCLKIGAGWVPQKRGLVMGIMLMGYGVGAFMWNALTTWYINHDNLQPDLRVGTDLYYTQSAVLDKVAPCFLVLGAVFGTIQVVCLLLIRLPPPEMEKTIQLKPVHDKDSDASSDSEEQDTLLEIQQPGREKDGGRQDYDWRQVLTSRVYWTLWFMLLLSSFGIAFVVPLFKAYGQTFIKDDHFLATVAMLSSICNAAGRPFWGLLADRFGPRMVCLAVQSALAILVATFSSCEVTGRVCFLLWVCAMFLIMCGFFTMIPVITHSVFGSTHFNLNMGLIDSFGILGSILPAVIAPSLKSAFGWNGLFFVGYAGLFIGILLNISLDWCKCGNSIPRNMHAVLSIQRYPAR